MSEEEMAGWNHQGNRYEFGQTSEDAEGQRSGVLPPWGHGELDTTGQLNNSKNNI